MKKKLLSFITGFLTLSAFAQPGLEGIVVEKFYVSNEADSLNADENFAVYPLHVGSVTYRVYANLLPGYEVIQMFGTVAHPLMIATETAFYNDPNYGFSVYQGTSVNNTKKHTTLIDSYLTVGGVANGLVGVLKTEDTDGNIGNLQGILANEDPSAGVPITGVNGFDGLLPGTPIVPNILGLTSELDVFDQSVGGQFSSTGGTVAALGGVAGVTESNHVLLGQFTTDGIFSFKLNIQIETPTVGGSQIFVAESPVGEEILDSTLTFTSQEEIIQSISESQKSVSNNYFLYPNPCKNQIALGQTSTNLDKTEISILDVTGRVVSMSNTWQSLHTIDTTELPTGVYTMRLKKLGTLESLKFIKQ